MWATIVNFVQGPDGLTLLAAGCFAYLLMDLAKWATNHANNEAVLKQLMKENGISEEKVNKQPRITVMAQTLRRSKKAKKAKKDPSNDE